MYQSFTGISDSLWIYWAHGLVCDWQKKMCENHLHNLIHDRFNTTFDNKQGFLTLNGGKHAKTWECVLGTVRDIEHLAAALCLCQGSFVEWGYLGIHWNILCGLLLLLSLRSPTAGSVQLMPQPLGFWPSKISSPIPSVKTSFLVTFIFPCELEVLLNILFILCLLHWPRGQAWEGWFLKRCFCHPSHIPCLHKSLQLSYHLGLWVDSSILNYIFFSVERFLIQTPNLLQCFIFTIIYWLVLLGNALYLMSI